MTRRNKPLSAIASKTSRFAAAIGMIVILAVSTAAAGEIPTTAPEKEGFSRERLVRLDARTHSYVDEGRTAGVIIMTYQALLE